MLPAGHRGTEVPQHDRTENVQAGMGTHQAGAALVIESTVDARARWGQRVSLSRQEVEVITLARTDNPSPDIPPQQYAVIRRLPTAAGIERGPIQHDPLIGIGEQNAGVPIANRGVLEIRGGACDVDAGSLARSWR
jgi:hypothetical protein